MKASNLMNDMDEFDCGTYWVDHVALLNGTCARANKVKRKEKRFNGFALKRNINTWSANFHTVGSLKDNT